jgi:hypothetical protein
MLPEKRKNLIIALIAIILIIVVAIIISGIGKIVQNKQNGEQTRRNDTYPTTYSYMGLVIDSENVYRINGLTQDFNEEYMGVRSFYNTTDIVNLNGKITLYSDALNEIRYDKKEKEYYLYAIDEFYEKESDALIGDGYIIYFKDSSIYLHVVNTDKSTDEVISDNYIYNGKKGIIYNNKFYYLESDGVHEYIPSTKDNNLIIIKMEEDEVINLLDADNNYLVYTQGGILKIFGIGGHMVININSILSSTDYSEVTFVGYVNHDILLEVTTDATQVLKKYSIMNNSMYDFEIDLEGFNVEKGFIINSNYYYIDLINDLNKEKHIIVDLTDGSVVKELENKYESIVVVR